MFSSINAPEFFINGKSVSSGRMSPGDVLKITAGSGSIYYTTNGKDPMDGGGILYAGDITLTGPVHVRARVDNGSFWSALSEIVLNTEEDLNYLKVTEIHYHPKADNNGNDNNYEFIELKNTGETTLDLSGVRIDFGIRYIFPNQTFLEPGKFIVLASNASGFYSRYKRSAFGEYHGQLGNAGDTIVIKRYSKVFSEIRYSDSSPWPVEGDGDGPSIVPVEISPEGDQDDAGQWRASLFVNGSPGRDDDWLTGLEKNSSTELHQNFPNPFHGTTQLSYTLESPAWIELKVYDPLGRELETVSRGFQNAGNHQLEFNAQNFSSGLMILKLNVDGRALPAKKMVMR